MAANMARVGAIPTPGRISKPLVRATQLLANIGFREMEEITKLCSGAEKGFPNGLIRDRESIKKGDQI